MLPVILFNWLPGVLPFHVKATPEPCDGASKDIPAARLILNVIVPSLLKVLPASCGQLKSGGCSKTLLFVHRAPGSWIRISSAERERRRRVKGQWNYLEQFHRARACFVGNLHRL